MSVLVPDDEYKKLYDFMRENIDAIPRKVIDDAIAEIELNISYNKNKEGLINLLGQGQIMALQIIKKHISEVEKE